MSVDLLLINTPIRTVWDASFFPIGLAYIAKFAAETGRSVKVIDANLTRPDDNELLAAIEQANPRYVGVTGISIQYGYVRKCAAMVRQVLPDAKTIVGGRLTAVPELVLDDPNIDVAVLGDGERTIEPLFDCLDRNDDLREVEGIAVRDDSESGVTATYRPFESDLDSLGLPAYDMFDVERYIQNQFRTHAHRGGEQKRSINVIASRGCIFNCSFCGEDRDSFRKRSIPNVISELEMLVDRYRVEHIHFSDGLFFSNRKRVVEFCDALDESHLPITWSGNARVDIITPELMDRAVASGCNLIAYGFESGSPQMLKAMNKTTTVEQNGRTVELHRERGLPFATSMILGAKGETWRTFFETWRFLMKHCFFPSSISYLMIYPGTPDWYYAIKNGNLTDPLSYVNEMSSYLESVRYSDKRILVNISNLPNWQLYIAGTILKYSLKARMWAANYGFGTKLRRIVRFGRA